MPKLPFDPDYPDRHPCVVVYCKNTVQFDDEPWCYTHSPDSGSDVRGYSYKNGGFNSVPK